MESAPRPPRRSRSEIRDARLAAFRKRRIQEEVANSLTHGAGLVLSTAGLVALLVVAVLKGGALAVMCFAIYGASLILLYAASTAYHSATKPRWRYWLQKVDHCSIYVLIAGTYTPFALLGLEGGLGWTVFVIIWGLAMLGIAGKVLVTHAPSIRSTLLYLGMGWLSVFIVWPLFKALGPWGFGFLVAGGIAYSLGSIFFTLDHRRFYHAIWHLFVIAGSAFHFAAIIFFLLPAS